ncbi:hypothetical protein H0H93_009100, partial [Arthromyces matolae]
CCASPVSQDLTPSAPIIAVEEPIKSQHPALLTVPEPVSTNTDSAKSTEQSTPAPRSPKTPSTLGPLSYLHSSPIPPLPSLPPPTSPTLSYNLPASGLGLCLASLPSQVSQLPKTSPEFSPIIRTHPPRKSRPDSSQYLLSPPPSEILDAGRPNMKTDKISELPNHFLSLPFAEGFFDDMGSSPKRTTVAATSESTLQPQATTPGIETKARNVDKWLYVRLYDDPESVNYQEGTWEIELDTLNTPDPVVWDQGYTFWEENGGLTFLSKNRKIPWEFLASYHADRRPLCLYRE